MRPHLGTVSDIGVPPARGGRARNEDNLLVCDQGVAEYLVDGAPHQERRPGDGVLLAVCDGMGGHADGHIASTTAVKVLAKLYQPGCPSRPDRVLLRYIRQAHSSLHHTAKDPQGEVHMGTTLTAAWILRGRLSWCQVGDSRLYLLREGQLTQLTTDHTRNAFARRDGRPATPHGAHLAQGFIYGSRGLGDDASLRLEHGRDSGHQPLHVGDRLLLCTDGISGVLPASTLGEILCRPLGPQQAALALCARAKAHGSTDNMTAIVMDYTTEMTDVEPWLDDGEETIHF